MTKIKDWKDVIEKVQVNDISATEILLAEFESYIINCSTDLDTQQELRVTVIQCAKRFVFNPNYNVEDYREWFTKQLKI